MMAPTNALIVLSGTAWSDETLRAQMRAVNLDHEARTGQRRHVDYDWHACAEQNPTYQSFVHAEIARLGEQHVAIHPQSFLWPISGVGSLCNAAQRALLTGTHRWQEEPTSLEHTTRRDTRGIRRTIEPHREITETYLAGIDIGGEERVTHYVFSRPTKSRLAFQFLAFVNSGRMKHYRKEDAPEASSRESWFQLSKAR